MERPCIEYGDPYSKNRREGKHDKPRGFCKREGKPRATPGPSPRSRQYPTAALRPLTVILASAPVRGVFPCRPIRLLRYFARFVWSGSLTRLSRIGHSPIPLIWRRQLGGGCLSAMGWCRSASSRRALSSRQNERIHPLPLQCNRHLRRTNAMHRSRIPLDARLRCAASRRITAQGTTACRSSQKHTKPRRKLRRGFVLYQCARQDSNLRPLALEKGFGSRDAEPGDARVPPPARGPGEGRISGSGRRADPSTVSERSRLAHRSGEANGYWTRSITKVPRVSTWISSVSPAQRRVTTPSMRSGCTSPTLDNIPNPTKT